MNKIITFVAILLLHTSLTWGATSNYSAQWRNATSYYMQKQYDSAAFYFEKIATANPRNAELYYNLGNTYYRLNNIALAVLNYERALQIEPDNKQAQDNLSITQARISHHISAIDEIFFIEWWRNITAHPNATPWAIGALICFILVFAAIGARRYSKIGSRIPVQLSGILGFIFACFLIFSVAAAKNSISSNKAVVTENDTPLMNEQLKGKPLALIPEGTTVRIISENDNWVEVSLSDGRTGWIDISMLIKV